jgi:hypothetical protein
MAGFVNVEESLVDNLRAIVIQMWKQFGGHLPLTFT